jgi:hypothetical protein
MVATAVLLLLHVPPGTLSVRVVVPGLQMFAMPSIGATGFTVTVDIAAHPVLSEYVMVAVPAVTAVAMPDNEPMIILLLLVHVPPEIASVKSVDDPLQMLVTPDTDANGFTVKVDVVAHPGTSV